MGWIAANASDQIDIQQGAYANWIGGIILDGQGNPVLDENGRTQADPNKRNIISGGNGDGLEVTHATETMGDAHRRQLDWPKCLGHRHGLGQRGRWD
ncbi:MAG: hypothetical protein IPL28_04100 [Chloroflexi bacterium]|nr:hypothetical protein [Chloroflexota bacterium]